jgi:hypothetical protein
MMPQPLEHGIAASNEQFYDALASAWSDFNNASVFVQGHATPVSTGAECAGDVAGCLNEPRCRRPWATQAPLGGARCAARAARDSAKNSGGRVPCSHWAIRSRLTIALRSSIGEAIAGLRLRDRHVQHARL